MVFDHDSQHVKHLHTYSCTISCCKLVVVFLESSSDDLPLPLQPAFSHHSVPGLVGSVGNCCEASQSWKTLFWKERVVIHSFWLSCFWKEKRKAKGFRAINPLSEKKKNWELVVHRPFQFFLQIILAGCMASNMWQASDQWHPVARKGIRKKKGGSKGPGNLQFYHNKYLACWHAELTSPHQPPTFSN